jgi:hypothetical protein
MLLRITFGPEDAFGAPGSMARTTANRAEPPTLRWDENAGVPEWEGGLLDALRTRFELGDLSGTWDGNVMTVTLPVSSMEEARSAMMSASHILPATLCFRLGVPVWIKEFTARLNGSAFRLVTPSHRPRIRLATTDENQAGAVAAVRDWEAVHASSLRVVMAMYYYRQAIRLAGAEPDRQAMIPEVVRNLAKAVEAVFDAKPTAVRAMARDWGLDEDLIERRILPLFRIHRSFDAAHVSSATVSSEQHQLLEDFVEAAITHVGALLSQVVERERTGAVVLDEVSRPPDRHLERLCADLSAYLVEEPRSGGSGGE